MNVLNVLMKIKFGLNMKNMLKIISIFVTLNVQLRLKKFVSDIVLRLTMLLSLQCLSHPGGET